MGQESQVQVAPDSTGKSVRTLEVTTYVNGVATVVEMQVVALADDQGRPLSLTSQKETLELLYAESRLQTEILLRILAGIDHEKLTRAEMLELIEQSEIEQETNT